MKAVKIRRTFVHVYICLDALTGCQYVWGFVLEKKWRYGKVAEKAFNKGRMERKLWWCLNHRRKGQSWELFHSRDVSERNSQRRNKGTLWSLPIFKCHFIKLWHINNKSQHTWLPVWIQSFFLVLLMYYVSQRRPTSQRKFGVPISQLLMRPPPKLFVTYFYVKTLVFYIEVRLYSSFYQYLLWPQVLATRQHGT